MKTLFNFGRLGFTLILGASSLSAVAQPGRVNLNNLSVVNLGDVSSSEIEILKSYPGRTLSGVCSIVLATGRENGERLRELTRRLNFSKVFHDEATAPAAEWSGLV
ncbi:MAG: hypothetical protein ABIR96_00690, partial [Bdellovibrionota bacterium]